MGLFGKTDEAAKLAQEAAKEEAEEARQDEAATPTVAAPDAISTAHELATLAQLRDQGVLTDAEFAAQKAKLLGSAL